MLKGLCSNRLIIAVIAAVTAAVIICVLAVSCSGGELEFETCYYFVCYRITDNAVSASSLSNTASSYGGAGYILHYNGNYYVTVSCYYRDTDAEAVCSGLKKREPDCSVLEVKTQKYKLNGYSAKNNGKLYLGNLNTLNSLSIVAYQCANGLDDGEFTQDKAKSAVAAVKNGLNGLLLKNSDNCFTRKIKNLLAECEDKERGYILSKDMRYLQIALTDAVINAELY